MQEKSADAPIFILGAQRSGTTMFRLMLNAHPRIAVPPESHFIRSLVQHLPLDRALNEKEKRTATQIIIDEPRFADWGIDPYYLNQTISELIGPNLRQIIDATFRIYLEIVNKPRWGDKTPEYAEIAEQLNVSYPDARFIHVMRDGRDVVNSLGALGWQGVTIRQRGRYWKNTVAKIHRLARLEHEGRYLLVRYEDLVADTESELMRVCHYLGENFAPEMLQFHHNAVDQITKIERDLKIHDSVSRDPEQSDIAKWRRENRAITTLVCELVLGPMLEKHNYRCVFSRWTRVFVSVLLPLYFAYSILINVGCWLFYHSLSTRYVHNLQTSRLYKRVVAQIKSI